MVLFVEKLSNLSLNTSHDQQALNMLNIIISKNITVAVYPKYALSLGSLF